MQHVDGPPRVSTTIRPSQTSSAYTSMFNISSSPTISSTIDTPSNLTTPTHLVAIVASVSVVGVVLFFLALILMLVMVLYRLHHVQIDDFESKQGSNLPPTTVVNNGLIDRLYENGIRSPVFSSPVQSSKTAPYVLLIFSQNTPSSDQDLIRSYGLKLNKTVTVKMYDAADRLTRTAWLEQNYGQAAAILCVCNKAFAMEWNNSSSFAGGSIVSAAKMIVQGQIEHQTVPEKFAALFINEEDRELTPPYLKNVRSFKLCLENIEAISRFALSVNEYRF